MSPVPPATFPLPSRLAPTRLQRCDIFCRVIDNYGDIGVCWRLTRQLAHEYGLTVRLWVDDLAAFFDICPEIDPQRHAQVLSGIEIFRWSDQFDAISQNIEPGDLVIEAFACHLPESFVHAMARKPTPVIWINLDYLSAEAWVGRCHALPSPHPRLPLTKYFFFPGFDENTGGLLRERDLNAHRQQFLDSASERTAFWRMLGFLSPSDNWLKISLFAYENPALPKLFEHLTQNGTPVCCLMPMMHNTQAHLETFLGHPVRAGASYRRGALEIRMFSLVAQPDYDRLLWLCDINFVRGEDSFVRAQWAAHPLVWQIYPQSESAHLPKLEAFLKRYTATLGTEAAVHLRRFYLAWNGFEPFTADSVDDWLASLPELRRHAQKWQEHLSRQPDLCSALVNFCQSGTIMSG